MNILVVSYLPRGERSITKMILSSFLESLDGHTIVEHELSKVQPVFFSEALVERQIEQFYSLSSESSFGEYRMNQYQLDVTQADIIIVAHPIWNWNIPAPIKAWVDAIAWVDDLAFHGATEDSLSKRIHFDRKKVLSINVSGMNYDAEHLHMKAARTYIEAFFRNLGAEMTKTISLSGVDNIDHQKLQQQIRFVQSELNNLKKDWGVNYLTYIIIILY